MNRNKKILFIIPPTGNFVRESRCQSYISNLFTVCPRPPLELTLLAAIAEEENFDCEIIDASIKKLNFNETISKIRNYSPWMLVFQTTASTLHLDIEFCKQIKKIIPEIIITGIGPPLLDEYEDVFKSNNINFALHGEIEWAFNELICGKEIKSIKGLIYKQNGKIKINPPQTFKDMNLLPIPARHLLDNSHYVRPDNRQPQLMIEVQRGCNQKCLFCLAPIVGGDNHRYRTVQKIVDEIVQCIETFGINNFFLRSDNLTADPKWIVDFCDDIISKKININWIATSRTNQINEKIIHLMKKAGCWGISFGIESGDEGILNKIGKGTTVEQNLEAIQLCKNSGIVTNGFFIIGFPWDTKETIENSIKFACQSGLDNAEFLHLVPFKNTKLHRYLEKNNLLEDFPYESYCKPANSTFQLNSDELIQLKKKALNSFVFRFSFLLNSIKHLNSFSKWVNAIRILFNIIFSKIKFTGEK